MDFCWAGLDSSEWICSGIVEDSDDEDEFRVSFEGLVVVCERVGLAW